jgi:hypothetical protein
MRPQVTHVFAASLIAAVVIVGGWAARPAAHENYSTPGLDNPVHDHHPGALVEAVREATGQFRDPVLADAAGYKPQFGCVSGPDRGAMGLHFVNFPLVADGKLDVASPELVIYEQLPSGHLKLTGVEFLVLKDQWDAAHTEPPQVMGQLFHLNDTPNRYRLPAFYSLHVWAWKENPFGAFVNWHPNVSCESFSGTGTLVPPDPGED